MRGNPSTWHANSAPRCFGAAPGNEIPLLHPSRPRAACSERAPSLENVQTAGPRSRWMIRSGVRSSSLEPEAARDVAPRVSPRLPPGSRVRSCATRGLALGNERRSDMLRRSDAGPEVKRHVRGGSARRVRALGACGSWRRPPGTPGAWAQVARNSPSTWTSHTREKCSFPARKRVSSDSSPSRRSQGWSGRWSGIPPLLSQ